MLRDCVFIFHYEAEQMRCIYCSIGHKRAAHDFFVMVFIQAEKLCKLIRKYEKVA